MNRNCWFRCACLALILLSVSVNSFAFLYEVEIIDKKAISKLSDDDLTNAYIEVEIEITASKSFHEAAGYTPPEYKKFKNLLRFRVHLLMEMQKREIEPPKIIP